MVSIPIPLILQDALDNNITILLLLLPLPFGLILYKKLPLLASTNSITNNYNNRNINYKNSMYLKASNLKHQDQGKDNLSTDLWAWRKYGQKPIKGSPYPRNYYRCSSSKGCTARKQVERSNTESDMFIVTYTGDHNHPRPTHRNSLAGSTRTKSPAIQPPTSISCQPNPTTSCSSSLTPNSFGEEEEDIDMEIETDEEGEDGCDIPQSNHGQ
ncbi:hypothetical protein TSUD_43830 [Trifolium subterraneum]|uniref:WRKY domain-containing protein n=1 Tax=Trifolium subterraneum TaxID=3900 RepID=A0A2Z6MLI6_TRISU|nr:hypothetical protein TSUD_43830 [Trifolium subterraneum]